MSESAAPLSPQEIADRGDKLYAETIGRQVASALGQIVAIDVHSGDFSLAPNGVLASRDLRTRKPDAEVWLVRVGSRYYARNLRESGRAAQFKFGILWDMIGDRDLTITLSPDSPADLTREVLASAAALSLGQHFGRHESLILDDHVPLTRTARIPAIDLIDFDYDAWHTADDKLDHLAPESLQKIGAVTLHHLRKALGK